MKKVLFFIGTLILTFTSCTTDRDIKEETIAIDPDAVLIYYWHFNSLSGSVAEVVSDYPSVSSKAMLSYPGTGAGYLDSFNPGYSNNKRHDEIEGNGIRTRNPSNTRSLLFGLPTTGFKKVVFQFATARTSAGATTQNYSYTTDGTNYTDVGLNTVSFNPGEDPSSDLVTLDFSSIEAANDNPNFKIKINFSGEAAAGASGNNRFDNITLDGIPIIN